MGLTLDDILTALSDLDSAPAVEFDPAEVLGNLVDKVDAIHKVMGRLKNESARLEEIAEQFKNAAKGCERNAERLKAYVIFTMKNHGFEKLPGKDFRIQLQKTTPAMELDHEAGPDDALAFPVFVSRKTIYAWDRIKLKEYLQNGGSFEYGRLKEGQTARFYINKGDQK